MGALGNIIGLFPVDIPTGVIGVTVALNFSQLPALLTATGVGPLEGGLVGLISTILSTVLVIRNPFVPIGNFVLGYAVGYFARRRRPLVSCILGEIVESPFIWATVILWSGLILGVPIGILVPVIATINIKAFLEVGIGGLLCQITLARKEFHDLMSGFRSTD